jgi:RNA polymerase sigma-70 factor, ECF subfamily
MSPTSRSNKDSVEALMARFQQSLDPSVFEQIVALFLKPGLAVARQLLGDATLAEDAVQDAFLRVVRGSRQYSPSKPFSNWFYTILRNACIDMQRGNVRQTLALRELALRQEAADAGVASDSNYADLEMLQLLPEGEREVLMFRVVEGLTFPDIAAATGLSEEAAKKRAQRGLGRLREMIQSQDVSRMQGGTRSE